MNSVSEIAYRQVARWIRACRKIRTCTGCVEETELPESLLSAISNAVLWRMAGAGQSWRFREGLNRSRANGVFRPSLELPGLSYRVVGQRHET